MGTREEGISLRSRDLPRPSPHPALAGEGARELTEERKFPWNLFLCFLAQLGHPLEGEARPKTRPAMALALRPPRVPKPKRSLPSHYHESFLEKKGPRDRVRRARELALLGGRGRCSTSLSLDLHNRPRIMRWVLGGAGHGLGAGKGYVPLSVCLSLSLCL